MPRYFTMPYGAEPGVWEGDVYRGSVPTAIQFGVLRLRDKDTNADLHYHLASGTFVQEGWRFGRRVLEQDPSTGSPIVFGDWAPLHAQGEPEHAREKLLVKMDVEIQSSPGGNMRDPDGFLIWLNGSTVPQPASGEPERDPWTGELTGGTVP